MSPLQRTISLLEFVPVGTILSNSDLESLQQADPVQKEWLNHKSAITGVLTFMWDSTAGCWFTLAGDALTAHTLLNLPWDTEKGVLKAFCQPLFKESYEKEAKNLGELYLRFY